MDIGSHSPHLLRRLCQLFPASTSLISAKFAEISLLFPAYGITRKASGSGCGCRLAVVECHFFRIATQLQSTNTRAQNCWFKYTHTSLFVDPNNQVQIFRRLRSQRSSLSSNVRWNRQQLKPTLV